MTPSRVVRVLIALLFLLSISSGAMAATTEFRVLFDVDNDSDTGCTVNDMDGVEQVLVTETTEGDPMRVTRTYRQQCMGMSLGSPMDINTEGWGAGWNPTSKLLTVETRIPFMAFGAPDMPRDLRVGFDATRTVSEHSVLVNADGTQIVIPPPPVRRRAISPDRHITMNGNLTDWGKITPAVFGVASTGTDTLRLLRLLAWPDTNDNHIYFAVTAYLGSDHPWADDDVYQRLPNESVSIPAPGVLDNDGIPGNAPLTAEKVSDPSRGTVTLNPDGSFTYSPTHPQLLSPDEFEYKAKGAGKESNVARVIIQVNQGETPQCPGQEHPNAPCPDQYTTEEDQTKVVSAAQGVLANDPHSDNLVASLLEAPDHGTVVLNANGGFTYNPDDDFFGTDTFVYTATKLPGAPPGIGGNATVTIIVTPVNDPPTIDPATFTIPENSPNGTIVGTPSTFDADGDTLSCFIQSGNTGGAFAINANTCQITVANSAAVDFETNPTFALVVRVEDGDGDDTAIITINLTDTNEPPVINLGAAGPLNYTENDPPTVINGTLTVTDTDSPTLTGASVVISANFVAGQDVLSFTPVGAITGIFSGNTLTLSGTDTVANYQTALRSVRYQNLSENPSTASRTITWTATDGTFTSAPVTSTVNVTAVNDAPVNTVPGAQATGEDTPLTFSTGTGNVIAIGDIDGSSSVVTLVATNGTLTASPGATIVGNGTANVQLSGTNVAINTSLEGLVFNPTANYNGAAQISMTTNDQGNTGTGGAQQDVDVIAITVTAVNDQPVVNAATFSLPENSANGTNVGTVTFTDNDAGQTHTFAITAGNTGGAFAIHPSSGQITVANQAALDFETNPTFSLTVTVTDNSGAGNAVGSATITVNLTNVNEAPVLTAGGTLNYTENDPATAIDTTITVADVDSANIVGATAQITGNYQNGQDVLSYVTALGITGVFAPGTGTLTLSGTATVANYQTALRNVLYNNTSNTPSTLARTVTWQVNDGAGVNNLSNTPTSTVNVAAVNDAPVLTSGGGSPSFTEGGAAVVVDGGITVTDVDDTNLESATVTITNLLDGASETLAANTGGTSIVANYLTGVLTLTGTDTLANYETVLRSVTYANSSDNPNTTARSISFVANDGDVNSNTVSKSVAIVAVNDAPVLTAGGSLSYTENDPASAIDTTITVTDVDSTTMSGATAQITGNYVNGQDVLSYVTALGITGVFAPGTGTLTLSGVAPIADYQTALRNVLYNNTSDNPSTLARTVTWQVNDGAGVNNLSNTPTSTINVAAVNDAPVVNAVPSFGYTEGTGAQVIDPALTTSDVDDTQYSGATVQITANYVMGEDVLAFVNAFGITGVFTPATGTLTLSGTTSIGNYQSALRTITYQNTSSNPSVAPRTVTWTVSDMAALPGSDTTTINITAVNSAPVLTAGGSLNYNENDPPSVIDNTITVSDVDSPTMSGATVQITGNCQSEDVLSYVTALGITGVYVPGTCTLTLSGVAPIADYQTALRNVLYNNTSDTPSTLARTVTWQVNDGAGVNNLSNTPTSTINVAAVNDAPVVNAAASFGYTEGTGAVVIDSTLTTSDVDDTQYSGATIQITANYVNGEDILAFTNAFGITGVFTPATGTLTLSGTTSIANYQSALRTITYQNTSSNPSVAPRTVTWTVFDIAPLGGSDTTTINITPVNSAPVLTAGGTLNYTENNPASVIDNTVTVTDADTPNLVGATVQITGNYVNGQDVLSYVPALGITGVFAPATGTLTLTGTTTPANWQTALRNVLYVNTSENPSTAARTVTWQIDDGEAVDNLSNTPTSTINVAAVNDPPTINAAPTLAYTEDDGAVVIDNTVAVADVDDTNLVSATVQITANYVNGEDILAFTNAFGITGVFTPATGTLTLSGTTTVANYQSALRTITYQNTSQNPSTATRTLTWTVNDASSPGSDTSTITVASVNDAPVLTLSGTLNYTENDPATNAATSATITDADDTNIESATIQITTNYQNGQDVLSYVTALGITGVFAPATGTLTLSGTSSLANYQTALLNVKYANTSENPSTAARTVTWNVNDGDVNSNNQTTTVNVTAVNDAPVVTPTGTPLGYTENDPPTAVQPLITVTDVDSTNLTGATVQITTNYVNGQDVLSYVTALGITGVFTPATGTLTLSGTTTVANYQTALRNVLYNNTSESPSTLARTVVWQVNDGAGVNNLSTPQNSTINVNSVNDPPALTVAATPTPTYTENGAPITIATSASIIDVDDVNIESATVQITGAYEMGADVLAYTTALGITGVFAPATGTLTLSGTSSLANYATALQNVTFVNTSENPSALQRTVTWIVNDGSVNSNSQTTNINVINVNDPPTINANDLAYTEDSGAVTIDATLTVTDLDDALLPSASVQITANYVNGQDILAFTNAFGITGNFVAATGTLTLTGPASPANFQSALRTVTYQNTSNNPSIAPRTVLWTVNDDEPSSGTDTTTITVTATNDAPVLTLSGTLNYTENDPATNAATSATITDADDTNIESATIQITTNYQNGQDVLSYVTALGITGVFTPATGTLALTGSATLANYQTALLNVKYANTSENPSTLARTITWTVNDGDVNSNSQTSTVNVTSVNDAPVVTPTGTPLTYTENDPATAVQPLITVTDVDSTNLTGATVQITTNYQNGQDVLSYVTALGITGVFTPATGTLTLSGTTTVANYQTALRNVLYNNTSENPSQLARTVAWQVNDGAGVNNLSTIVNSTINVIAVNDAPTVVNESFQVLGNTELRVDMVAGTTPHTSHTVNNAGAFQGLIFNDSDVESDPFTITAVGSGCGDAVAPFDCTLASGAVVHVDANGEFSFTPGPGDTTDSFQYTITDTPTVGTAASSIGTVTFNFFEMIWYVRQGGSGNGTSISPFGNMDSLDGVGGAGDSDDNDDYIFVHNTGTPLALSLSVPLEANQHMLGEGFGLSIPVNLNGNGSPTNLVAAGTRPQVTLAAGDMFTIANVVPIEIRGLNLTATAANVVALDSNGALSGSSTLTVAGNTISGNGADAIDVNLNAGTSGTLNLSILSNDWTVGGTHTGNGIDVVRTAGTLNVNISNNTNVHGTGTGINVNGTSTITAFDSNTVHQNNGGAGVTITNATFDTVSGAPYVTVTGGTMTIGIVGDGVGGAGMTLTNVTGALGFTDLDIIAGTSAFTLTGTGAANIAAGTGTQVTVGAGVADFRSAGAAAVDVTSATVDLRLANLQTANTGTRAVNLVSVGDSTTTAARFSAAAGSITTTGAAAGPIFNVSGAGSNAGISYAGSLNNNGNGRAILVDSLSMDDATDDLAFTGAITENGSGILLNANSGAGRSITFSGGVTTNTTTGEGFGATSNTNSLGLNITGTNILSSTAATALRITNTTIGASNATFRSITSGNNTGAADPASGIILTTTGALGRLIVTGNAGTCNSIASCTGGFIRDTTSHGIDMNNTLNPSFTRMALANTAGSGINGTAVAGFTVDNSFIDNNGTGGGADESNIAFDVQAAGTETNLSGIVTITNNILTNARWHGVRILNFNGTISDVAITGNTITSATAIASSLGSGIHFQAIGSAGTAANVTKGNINNNTITNFPSGAGIVFAGGNANAAGPGTTTGTPGSVTDIINMTGNVIQGQSAANRMGVSAFQVTVSGANSGSRSQGNFDISTNGTVAIPLRFIGGVAMNIGANGYATMTVTTNGNRLSPGNSASSPGIGGGNGVVLSSAETPDMTWTINNNNIANTDGNGILAVGRGGNGILKVKIQNNTVAAPLGGVRPGIRVDAGNGAVGADDDVCMNMSGNTSAGSGGSQGLGLRKQGTSTTVNAFGINALPAGSTATPLVEAYINGLNPAGGGTLLISATSGFSTCPLP